MFQVIEFTIKNLRAQKEASKDKREKKQTAESNPQRMEILYVSDTEYKTDMFNVFKERKQDLKIWKKNKI